MRVLVCGGRDYRDWGRVMECLDCLNSEHKIKVVIHGCAKGADDLADHWAKLREKHVLRFPASWTQGPSGGPIRNQKMIDLARPELVVAFPGGRGTADMVRRAKQAGIPVQEIPPSPKPAAVSEGGEDE